MIIKLRFIPSIALLVLVLCQLLYCQTFAITFQGSLGNAGVPAGGNHDFELALFNALSGGSQLGSTQTLTNIAVVNGIFSVQVDFGNNFPGSNRFLEVRVRQSGGGGFTTLSPRQPITSSPYSIKSLASDSAATAVNATQLGGIAANQFIITSDPRLSDARNPLPGSASYVQNTAVQQAGGNFNISGTGTAGVLNASTQYNLAGSRILSSAGTNNFFAGVSAGAVNTTGVANAFFGTFAGQGNTTGGTNSFFGSSAGFSNIGGSENAFLGASAGSQNTTGNFNTFAGSFAGFANTTGLRNAFFGSNTGSNNSTGFNNSFLGTSSGLANTTGSNNTLIGHAANFEIGNLTFATAIGAGASVGSNNTIVLGRAGGEDLVHVPGNLILSGTLTGSLPAGSNSYIQNSTGAQAASNFNISGTGTASIIRANTQYNLGGNRIIGTLGSNNLFVGVLAGAANAGGSRNAFFGAVSGTQNTTGIDNAIFGALAGFENVTGNSNAFFGTSAGFANTVSNNSFFGANAGLSTTTGGQNSFFGKDAGSSNTFGSINSFFGNIAGMSNTLGVGNAFFGSSSGRSNTTASFNSFFGQGSGDTHTTGSNNTFIGRSAGNGEDAGSGVSLLGSLANASDALTNATALGFQAVVTQSDSLILGSINGVNGSTASTNVGIGTTAPEKKLHVRGPSSVEVQIESSDSGGRKWTLQSSSGGNNGRFEIIDRTANASRLTILNDGNLGIGTTAPADKLHVNGILRVNTLGAAGVTPTPLCRNSSNQISTCASPRPHTTNVGDIANETPLRELQLRIESQQRQIDGQNEIISDLQKRLERQGSEISKQKAAFDALRQFVCSNQPAAELCRPIN